MAVSLLIGFLFVLSPFVNWGNTAFASAHSATVNVFMDKFIDNSGSYDNWPVPSTEHRNLYVGQYIAAGLGYCQTVIRFDLPDLGTANITSARLRFGVRYSSGAPALNIYGSNDDAGWTETDATIPNKDVTILTGAPITEAGTYYADTIVWQTLDVTGFVASQYGGDRSVTLVLSIADTGRDNDIAFGSSEDDAARPQLLLDYTQPTASLQATPAATEANINGNNVTLTLEDLTFADSSLSLSNFTLSGAPAGLSISGVSYTDATHCQLTMAHDGRDFDGNFNFAVTINQAELTTGAPLLTSACAVTANNDAESLAAAGDGAINEGAENGEVITVTLAGGQFAGSINPANWTVNGLPSGVTKGAVTRVNDTTATIRLSGNATADYDTNRNVTVSCTADEYTDSAGVVLTSNDVQITANNDRELFFVNDDGMIAEGVEDGEIITVTISGGQFVNPITPANWNVLNLPAGVTKDTVTRVNNTTVTIALSGNAALDYDSDIGLLVFVSNTQYADPSGSFSISYEYAKIYANNDDECITAASDGLIAEGAEDGEVITVTLSGGQFASPIIPDNWTVTGLPAGVSKGAVTRVNATTVMVALSGNATADYDTDITNVTASCTAAEYADSTGGGTLTSNGVTITADNDAESITAASDGNIAEGAEDGELITVTLSGGQFAGSINPDNWTVIGMPAGVSKGAVTRMDDDTVTVALTGNATADYDTNRNVAVSCTADEYTDFTGGGTLVSNGLTITADDDAESITAASDGNIAEGAENGEVLTVTLSGGQFAGSINPANWTVDDLPAGVSKGAVTRVNGTTVTVELSGNAMADYDSDITHVTVSCTAAEYTDSTDGDPLTSDGLTITADDDAESITAASDGNIAEGAENGEVLTVTLSGGQFANPINPTNWTVTDLPAGVSKGTITRVNGTTVTVELSGNAMADYDSDITHVTVSCTAAEYTDSTSGDPLTSGDVTITAADDAESIAATSGTINEDAEDGKVITVTLSGGQFTNPINPANWTVTGLPAGVSKGAVTRVDNDTVTVALSGNATADYDENRTVTVTCTAAEYTDSTGGDPLTSGGVQITADDDAESIAATSGTINEGAEDGKVITVTLSGGQFTNPINPANWTVTGLPAGVTKGAVTRVNNSTVTVTLSGNATADFDDDINISITCAASQYVDGNTPLTASGSVVIWAELETDPDPDPTASPSPTPSATPSLTPSPTPSATPSPTPRPTSSRTPTPSPTPAPSETEEPGDAATEPPEPTASGTATASPGPTATPTPTGSAAPGGDSRVVYEEQDTATGIVAVGVESVAIPELADNDVEKVVVQLVVKRLDSKQPGSIAIASGKLDEQGKELLMVFDASLIKTVYRADGTSADHQVDNSDITGTITVRIPLPAEFESMPGLTIVYIGDDGAVTELRTKQVTIDGVKYLEFETDHFSQYAIISRPQQSVWWIWLIVFVAVVAIGLAAVLLLKRRAKKE